MGSSAGDQLGYSVAISGNGQRVAAGAPFREVGGAPNAGSVYTWDEVGDVTVEIENDGVDFGQGLEGDNYGWSVALSEDGDQLAAGAPAFDTRVLGGDTGYVDWFPYAFNPINPRRVPADAPSRVQAGGGNVCPRTLPFFALFICSLSFSFYLL